MSRKTHGGPGTPNNPRVRLGNIPAHSIVRVDGRWGVVDGVPNNKLRIVDFWWEGREYVSARLLAEVQR